MWWLRLRPLRYALNIQNQEFAESDCVTPLMICVRSSFDSGAVCVRLPRTRPKDFVSALAECLKILCPRVVFATTFI